MSESVYYTNKNIVSGTFSFTQGIQAGSVASQGTLQYGTASEMQGGSAVLAQTLQAGSIASQGTLQYGSASAMQGGSAVLAQTLQAGQTQVATLAAQTTLQYGATSAMQGGSAQFAQTVGASTLAAQTTLQYGTSSAMQGGSAVFAQQVQTAGLRAAGSATSMQLLAQGGAATFAVQSSAAAVIQVAATQALQVQMAGGGGAGQLTQVRFGVGSVQSAQSSGSYSSFFVSQNAAGVPPAVTTNPVLTTAGQTTGGFLYAMGSGTAGSAISTGQSAAGGQSAIGCYLVIASGHTTASDMRLKKEIKQLTGHGLSSVAKLKGFLYEPSELAKEMHPDNPIDVKVGLSAQEVYKVAPEVVNTGGFPVDEETGETPEPSMSIDYSRLVPYLIEAVKELKTRVEALESLTGSSGTV